MRKIFSLIGISFLCLLVLVVIGFPMVFFVMHFFANACITETRANLHDLSGLNFKISETNCDTLAKDDAINVYVSSQGTAKETLIFKFDPAWPDIVPSIEVRKPKTIFISIATASEIFVRLDHWEDYQVKYKFGRVAYPTAPAKQRN